MIECKLIVRLKGGLTSGIKAKRNDLNRFEKDEIYLVPDDYDFSNGYFEIIEKPKKAKKETKVEVNDNE